MADPTRPIGSFLSILPEPRPVAPMPDRPGWLRITTHDCDMVLCTDVIVAVETRKNRVGQMAGTWIQMRDGTTVHVGKVPADEVLRAMDQADDEGPGAAAPAFEAPIDLLQRMVARRNTLASAASLAEPVEIPRELGLLRDQALCLAQQASHPRDLLLLVRDAAREAAAELIAGDSPLSADRFLALANMLERDAYRHPAGAPMA